MTFKLIQLLLNQLKILLLLELNFKINLEKIKKLEKILLLKALNLILRRKKSKNYLKLYNLKKESLNFLLIKTSLAKKRKTTKKKTRIKIRTKAIKR